MYTTGVLQHTPHHLQHLPHYDTWVMGGSKNGNITAATKTGIATRKSHHSSQQQPIITNYFSK
jgi:hypothetical protein